MKSITKRIDEVLLNAKTITQEEREIIMDILTKNNDLEEECKLLEN